jgi:hypothetical protein
VPAITSTASEWATISPASTRPAAKTPPRPTIAARRPLDASAAANVGTKTAVASGIVQGAYPSPALATHRAATAKAQRQRASAPLARHRSRPVKARTAPRSGGASTPSGLNDHQWLTGASSTTDVAATAIPGRAPRRESQTGSSAATSAMGNHQMAAKRTESGRRTAAFAATVSQWSRADGTSRAVGATSSTSGKASGVAKLSSPRDMRPRSQGVARFHSSNRMVLGVPTSTPGAFSPRVSLRYPTPSEEVVTAASDRAA